GKRPYEKEADKFAGRFLVPTEELVRVWEEEGLGKLRLFDALILLKRIFHVSFWCLLFRVVESGLHQEVDTALFTTEVKRRLQISRKATKDQLEPDQLPPDVLYTTNRFGRLVRSAFLQ